MPFKRKSPYDWGPPDLWAIAVSSLLPNLTREHREELTNMLLTDPETKKLLTEKLLEDRIHTNPLLMNDDKVDVLWDRCFGRVSEVDDDFPVIFYCFRLGHLPSPIMHALRFLVFHHKKIMKYNKPLPPLSLVWDVNHVLQAELNPITLMVLYEGHLVQLVEEMSRETPKNDECLDDAVDPPLDRIHALLLREWLLDHGDVEFPRQIIEDFFEELKGFRDAPEAEEAIDQVLTRRSRLRVLYTPIPMLPTGDEWRRTFPPDNEFYMQARSPGWSWLHD